MHARERDKFLKPTIYTYICEPVKGIASKQAEQIEESKRALIITIEKSRLEDTAAMESDTSKGSQDTFDNRPLAERLGRKESVPVPSTVT